eukprot:CAMPEP_0197541210 /NCGR_PEP_ID=MMETSP1318-20131121/67033_1 /TAXON_ID=552666 /ORGANISM="Partenskyella glossopodia, Strain RCC365" /LENGTH=197 /DNA_ID=CAMNT_0043100359 /DNA_START=322 /DNA_END=915 /DNA_ORIENTATION=-
MTLILTLMFNPGSWDELKFYLETVLELAVCFDESGLDLIGLNRGDRKDVNNIDAMYEFFTKNPGGSTPLHTALTRVLSGHKDGTRTVIIISTDGCPNDTSLADFRKLVRTRLGKKPSETPIVFMICTDNDKDVEYLDSLDRAPWVGVVDDYETERRQIRDPDRRAQYNRGAHIVNIVLNWVPAIDKMDDDPCCCVLL